MKMDEYHRLPIEFKVIHDIGTEIAKQLKRIADAIEEQEAEYKSH